MIKGIFFIVFMSMIAFEFISYEPSPNILKALPPTHKYIGDLDFGSERNWAYFMPADPLLTWRLAKSIGVTSVRNLLYLTTPDGFAPNGIARANEVVPLAKDPNAFRVIILGGSSVFGEFVETPDQNLGTVLEGELKQRYPGIKIQLINAGVPGYTSAQEYLYIESELIKYQPDLIIIEDGWNDLLENTRLFKKRSYSEVANFRNSQSWLVKNQLGNSFSFRGSLLQTLSLAYYDVDDYLMFSATYRSIRHFFISLFEKILQGKFSKIRKEPLTFKPDAVEYYVENIERMWASSKMHNYKICFLMQPLLGLGKKPLSKEEIETTRNHIKYKEWQEITPAFYELAKKKLTELRMRNPGMCFESLENVFDQTTEHVYVDSGHLNLTGNQILARQIVNILKRNNSI